MSYVAIVILYLLTGVGLYALMPSRKRRWWQTAAIICLWPLVQAAMGAVCLAVLLFMRLGGWKSYNERDWLEK